MSFRFQNSDGSPVGSRPDFDEEARSLWQRLNLDPTKHKSGPYNSLDALWRHPSGGTFYVGNQMAAQDLNLLRQHGVTHVVNCTDSMPFFLEGKGINKAAVWYLS